MNSQQSNNALAPQATNIVSPVSISDTDLSIQYSPGREPVYTMLGSQDLTLNQSNISVAALQQTADKPTQPVGLYQQHSHGYLNTAPHQQTHQFEFSNEPPWVHALFKKIDLTHAEVVTINKRVSMLETEIKSLHILNQEVSEMKDSLNFVSCQFDSLNDEIKQTRETMKQNRSIIAEQANEINTLKEQALLDQGRSMRSNLVFSGIAEGDTHEDSEYVVRQFIKEKMKINSDNIEIERAHRIGGPRRQGKSRPIVAKFLRFKQKEAIKRAAPGALKGTSFGVNEQFPKGIAERRRQLIPIMKEHKKKGFRATLAFDKLHTDSATFIVKGNSVKRIDKGHNHQSSRQQSQSSHIHQSQTTYENNKNSMSATQAASHVQHDTRSLNPFHNLTSTTAAIDE